MKSRPLCVVALLISAVPAASTWGANDPADAADPAEQALAHTLTQRFPSLKIESIRPTPMPGMYEIFTGDRLVYADRNGDYLFVGDMLDARSRQNLSAARMETLDRIDFDKLPFDRAIKIVKGNGRRRFAVFADPDCPYCQALEREMRQITDVTVYVFLYPIDGLHPGATQHAHQIWCSPHPDAAWRTWLLERTPPPAAAGPCTSDPVEELQKLGKQLRIVGTPTIFLGNGYRLPGVPRALTLDIMLGPGPGLIPAETAGGESVAASSATHNR
jgi:thiol:disulfide interchange protein DsbC